eukprot:59551-Prorocentrum_minimum.AAC.1
MFRRAATAPLRPLVLRWMRSGQGAALVGGRGLSRTSYLGSSKSSSGSSAIAALIHAGGSRGYRNCKQGSSRPVAAQSKSRNRQSVETGKELKQAKSRNTQRVETLKEPKQSKRIAQKEQLSGGSAVKHAVKRRQAGRFGKRALQRAVGHGEGRGSPAVGPGEGHAREKGVFSSARRIEEGGAGNPGWLHLAPVEELAGELPQQGLTVPIGALVPA